MWKIQTSKLWLRLGATLTGVCYGAIGAFSIHMSQQAPNAELAGRAFWMGVTFLIAAFLAIAVSWLVQDLSNIWCIPSKKSKQTRLSMSDEQRRVE